MTLLLSRCDVTLWSSRCVFKWDQFLTSQASDFLPSLWSCFCIMLSNLTSCRCSSHYLMSFDVIQAHVIAVMLPQCHTSSFWSYCIERFRHDFEMHMMNTMAVEMKLRLLSMLVGAELLEQPTGSESEGHPPVRGAWRCFGRNRTVLEPGAF